MDSMTKSYLDNPEDACGEEAGVGASNAYGFEDGRRIVIDGIDTGAVLEDEKRRAEEHATKDGHNRKHFAYGCPLPVTKLASVLYACRTRKQLTKDSPTMVRSCASWASIISISSIRYRS
jgi:hypothetical protein